MYDETNTAIDQLARRAEALPDTVAWAGCVSVTYALWARAASSATVWRAISAEASQALVAVQIRSGSLLGSVDTGREVESIDGLSLDPDDSIEWEYGISLLSALREALVQSTTVECLTSISRVFLDCVWNVESARFLNTVPDGIADQDVVDSTVQGSVGWKAALKFIDAQCSF